MIGSIDPGSRRTGVSVHFPIGGPPYAWTIKDPIEVDAIDTIEWMIGMAGSGPLELVVEAQYGKIVYVNGRATIDFVALELLMYHAHMWTAFARERGVVVRLPKPSEWQGPTFRTLPKMSGKQLTTKQLSRAWCHRQFDSFIGPTDFAGRDFTPVSWPIGKMVTDTCDSVCMGRWWMSTGSKR